MGILWAFASAKGWLFTLTTLSVIRDANLDMILSIIIYVLYVIGCMAGFLIPLILCVLAPERADDTLTRLDHWMTRHNRWITVSISFFFGIVFLYRGTTGMMTG
jgi:uncharacterized membrane protein